MSSSGGARRDGAVGRHRACGVEPSPLVLVLLLVQSTDFAWAFASRETMTSNVPPGVKPPHRVALIGDFLSWSSADYKLRAAIEVFGDVEESLSLQIDEVEEDLLALQLRSFDPDTLLISVRTRAFEGLVHSILRTARAECRRGGSLVVLLFHLQAHAIPASDRAFARVITEHTDGTPRVDSYAARAPPLGAEMLRLFVDDWALLDADDLRDGGILPEWFGPSIPEWWCNVSPCDKTPCAGSEALHDIIVYVGAGGCGEETEGRTSEGCKVAEYVQRRYSGKRVLILQAYNASAAEEHLQRLLVARRTGRLFEHETVQEVDREGDGMTRKLLTSAKVVVIPEAGQGGISALQQALESMVLGGAAVVMSEAIIPGAGGAVAEDIINGTHALVFKAADVDGLGHLLDNILAGDEEREDEGRRSRAGAGAGATSPLQRCWLKQRACENACARHSALQKLSGIISEAHTRAREDDADEEIILPGGLSVCHSSWWLLA